MNKKARDFARLTCTLLPRNRSGVLEISFGWLFAIIAGAVILFLAIYLSTRLIGTEQEAVSAEVGKEIGILLNPLETGFESSRTTSITIPSETRIHNQCDDFGDFGRQIIQLDQKSFNRWVETDVDVGFDNKYIFSEKEIEGKKFYIFSKTFEFPFKISDLIYMTSSEKRYCFENTNEEIKQEISNLNQENLLSENCSAGDIKVCFSGRCDIDVNYEEGYLEKNNSRIYFDGIEDKTALMYAAIFSDEKVYECQVKRLMSRAKELSLLYSSKEFYSRRSGCEESLGGDLTEFGEFVSGLEDSNELSELKITAEEIGKKNDVRRCLLW